MPQRFLRPGITNSEIWNGVSFPAQSLFIRLLTLVDDYGRYDGRTSVIWSHCFAVWNENRQQDSVTLQQCEKLLQEIAAVGLVDVYEVAGKRILQISQWMERVRDGSKEKWGKMPANSGCLYKSRQPAAESCGILPPSSPPSPVPSPSPDVLRTPAESSATPPNKSASSEKTPEETKRFIKPTIEEVKLHCAKIGLPEDEGIKFWNWYESNGWRVGKNPMKSWQAAMITWRGNWQARNPMQRRSAIIPPTAPPRHQGGPL